MRCLALIAMLSSARALAEDPALSIPPPPPTLPEVPAPASPPAPLVERPTSAFGGATLGPGRFGVSALLGFPTIEVQAGVGLGTRVDFSLNYETFYVLSHELGLTARVELFEASGFRLLLSLRGSGIFFLQPPAEEMNGARWLTGKRNFNVSPGLVFSYQGTTKYAPRFSLEARYLLAISTQQETLLGHNVSLRGLGELPLSKRVAFLIALGVSVHLRPEDSIVMPSASIGISLNF